MNLYILYLLIYIRNFLISDWTLLPLDPITSFAAILIMPILAIFSFCFVNSHAMYACNFNSPC